MVVTAARYPVIPTLAELSEVGAAWLSTPRPGPGVCEVCWTFTGGPARCGPCGRSEPWLASMTPVSYSLAAGRLHHALAGYKRRDGAAARRYQLVLGAVLWRWLAGHERCVARDVGVAELPIVTVVPSGNRYWDAWHPLRQLVGRSVGPTRERYEPLLVRSTVPVTEHTFSTEKFVVRRRLAGEPVLLLDDTWTSGAGAQSAAAALRAAGSGPVAAVVIGRHLRCDWQDTAQRWPGVAGRFGWEACGRCAGVRRSGP